MPVYQYMSAAVLSLSHTCNITSDFEYGHVYARGFEEF